MTDADRESALSQAAVAPRLGRSRRFLLAGVFLLIGAVIAACAAYVGVTQWAQVSSLQKDGVRAVGVFHNEGAANCWRHRCWAEFELDGKKVEADLPALTAAKKNKVSREGEPITIRYRPSDPTVAAEEGGLGQVGAITAFIGFFSALFLIAGLVQLVVASRDRAPAQPS
ncbi:hypothetical protein ACWDR3_20415 [Streptomyces sp. NPDC001002]